MEFIDNQDCLDLLEGSPVNPSLAVFPLIDEACRMPRATYQVWYPPITAFYLKFLSLSHTKRVRAHCCLAPKACCHTTEG